jgi:DNA-directed RNA polymerase specialized sigma24 family protein
MSASMSVGGGRASRVARMDPAAQRFAPSNDERRLALARAGPVNGESIVNEPAVQRAIDRLPFPQREVVLLWAHGHDLTTIAEISGAPWETVVSRKR